MVNQLWMNYAEGLCLGKDVTGKRKLCLSAHTPAHDVVPTMHVAMCALCMHVCACIICACTICAMRHLFPPPHSQTPQTWKATWNTHIIIIYFSYTYTTNARQIFATLCLSATKLDHVRQQPRVQLLCNNNISTLASGCLPINENAQFRCMNGSNGSNIGPTEQYTAPSTLDSGKKGKNRKSHCKTMLSWFSRLFHSNQHKGEPSTQPAELHGGTATRSVKPTGDITSGSGSRCVSYAASTALWVVFSSIINISASSCAPQG